jgi:hypothetical protein
MRWRFSPRPIVRSGAAFHATPGLTLIVRMLDLIAWKRPIQPSSYSVTRPNGEFTPSPTDQSGSSGITK